MNNTLELEKKKAIEAYENGSKKEKIFLERLYGKKPFQKGVMDRIKTIEDVLEDNNITQEELDKMFANTPEHLKSQYIVELLCKSLNEGWAPDWDNSNEYKYYPWFKMSSSGFQCDVFDYWAACSGVGSRLCFKNRKLAVYAGEQFTEVFKKFMTIN